MDITVRNLTPLEQDITVQFIEDDVVTFCNHANYYLDSVTTYTENSDYETPAMICDRCNAYCIDNDEGWIDG